MIKEQEVAVNNVGDGKIASVGVGIDGEPPIKRKRPILKRFKDFLKDDNRRKSKNQ